MAFQKGHKVNLGKKHSLKRRRKSSLAHKGQHSSPNTEFKKGMLQLKDKDNLNWKGDKVGYNGLHHWIIRWKGQPTTCEKCGKSGLSGKKIHWANIDHKYRRVLDDYIRLCISCHQLYDFKMGFRKTKCINLVL